MAALTIFFVIPLAFLASILWTFLIIKRIKSKYKFRNIILLEFIKIFLIIGLTFIFCLVGMILIGIIGIPILLVIIVIGIIKVIKYSIAYKTTLTRKIIIKIIYNVFLVLIIFAIPVYILFAVEIGFTNITRNEFKPFSSENEIKDVVDIHLKLTNYGTPEITETHRFPYTKYIDKNYPDAFKFQISYFFRSHDIMKIKINKLDLITNSITNDLLESDFDIRESIYYIDNNSSSSSSKSKLNKEETDSLINMNELYLQRSENEIIDSLICSYPVINIESAKCIIEYEIILIKENGEEIYVKNEHEFIKSADNI